MLLPFVFNICGAFCLLVIIIVFEKGFCPSDRFCDQIFLLKQDWQRKGFCSKEAQHTVISLLGISNIQQKLI